MAADSPITVEFYGMARRRAGCAELQVRADTVGDSLAEVARSCPELAGVVAHDRLSPHFLLSVNAGPFVTDLNTELAAGDRVLLLSADAGG